jgi:RNA recognition motif-containing protein
MQGQGGRSKGCGIVEYVSTEEARHAIASLHDTELHKSMEPEGPINEYGIYCGNLAWEVSSEILKEYLSQIGPVESCEVFLYYDGRSQGSAIARFESKESATKAINELNDTDFRGRLLQVITLPSF